MNPTYDCSDDLAIAWINLSYVQNNLFSRQSKPILVSLNGRINFHSLTALMGPSGAGKTTLLKCINMRNNAGLTSDTKLFVNKYIPLRTCFITQDQNEHLFSGLTVRESLLFASKIKNRFSPEDKYRDSYSQTGPSLQLIKYKGRNSIESGFNSPIDCEPIDKNGNFDHNKNICKVLSELLLDDCSQNLVNDCSGGERKRLSIGLELVAQNKPNLLCIDEPTSGLDSNAAELVIQCLSQLSKRHAMAIVTSIHQPNSLILTMFDQLYVLAKGGHCVFSGRPNQLRSHLQECAIDCSDDVLPIEVLLKVSSKNITFNTVMREKIPKIKIQSDSEESPRSLILPNDDIDRLIETAYKKSTDIVEQCKQNGKQVFQIGNNEKQFFNLYHFYYLLLRGFTCLIRYQWRVSAALAIFCITIALFLKYLYGSDVGEEDGCLDITPTNQTLGLNTISDVMKILSQESKVTLNLKFHFFATAFLQFVSMACTILVFPSEVKIFLNEHHNNWYSTSSYYWAKYILEIPIAIIISCIYSFIIYYGTGQLNQNWRFAYFTLISTSGMFIANSLGYLIGIVFARNFQVATTSGVALFLVLILFSGFFIPLSTLHIVIRNGSNLSFIKLTFESILITIYGFERCSDSQIPLLLHQLDLKDNQLTSNLIWILGHLMVWTIIALLTLIYRANDFKLMFKRKPESHLFKTTSDHKKITIVSDYLNPENNNNDNIDLNQL